MALITAPKTLITLANFEFLATSTFVQNFLKTIGFYDDSGNPKINQERLPDLFSYALTKEIDYGYHFITYRTSEQYPEPSLMVLEALYKAMPKIFLAWRSWEPELYGVSFADMWNYSVDGMFTHGKKTVTDRGGTKTTASSGKGSTSSSGNSGIVSEDAPINADIETINTPSVKRKSSDSGTSSRTDSSTIKETRNLIDTETNSGSDKEQRTEKRSYENTNNAANFFKYFVDGGRDIISIIHDCCRFMVYEYNIPLF